MGKFRNFMKIILGKKSLEKTLEPPINKLEAVDTITPHISAELVVELMKQGVTGEQFKIGVQNYMSLYERVLKVMDEIGYPKLPQYRPTSN